MILKCLHTRSVEALLTGAKNDRNATLQRIWERQFLAAQKRIQSDVILSYYHYVFDIKHYRMKIQIDASELLADS